MIKIVTDSTANLPKEIVAELGITVIPTYVHFGAETLKDGVDLTTGDFYKRLVASTELPTTSQISVDEFKAAYNKLLDEFKDATIISLHVSAALSGIVESARVAAAATPEAKIRIFDTRSVALGTAMMAREAAQMACDSAPEADILKRLESMRDKLRQYWALETLEYLAKSGRIGRGARLLGGLLDLKPILTLKDGMIDPYGRQRGKAAAVSVIRELAIKETNGKLGVRLGVVHSASEEEAKKLGEELKAIVKPEVFMIGELGPSVGTYTGPGVMGITWWVPDTVTITS